MKHPAIRTIVASLFWIAAGMVASARAGETPASTLTQVAEEIGSLRNAKVALAMPGRKTEVTYFASPMSPEERAELKTIAPNLRIVTDLTPAQAMARASEADGVEGRYATPEFLSSATKLVWVQAMSAGVDRYVTIDQLVKSDRIVLTNHRGVHGPSIADHAMAMLLSLARDLRHHAANQAKREWGRGTSTLTPFALDGRTMLVVGIGGIGSEIAKRAKASGMRVWATRRSRAPGPEYVDRMGLSGELMSILPEADVVAIAVPLTTETRGMFDRAAFTAMKPGSYLINIARGPIVVTDDLVAALKSGRLAGACLDVTDPEPLPSSSPLWAMPNVVITPHTAGHAEVTVYRRWALLRENLRRFTAGEPLLNVVDKQAGY